MRVGLLAVVLAASLAPASPAAAARCKKGFVKKHGTCVKAPVRKRPPVPAPPPPPANPPNLGQNLVQNPGAESGTGSPTGTDVLPIPAWTTTGTMTAIAYQPVESFPTTAIATQIGGGANFFAGGPGTAASTATQTIDLAADAALVDARLASATLAGYLGGWEDQEDAATVDATYLSATGAAVGTLTIGPVTRANRQSLTTLLLRTATAAVPAGTRAVQITITATRQAGPYNDGYADNVAFTLRRA